MSLNAWGSAVCGAQTHCPVLENVAKARWGLEWEPLAGGPQPESRFEEPEEQQRHVWAETGLIPVFTVAVLWGAHVLGGETCLVKR